MRYKYATLLIMYDTMTYAYYFIVLFINELFWWWVLCLLCRRWMNWYRRFRGRTSPSPCGRRGRWRNTPPRISSTHSASGSRSGTLLLYWAVICTEPCSAVLNKTEDKPHCLHYIIYSLKYKNISLDSTQTTIKLHLRWAYKYYLFTFEMWHCTCNGTCIITMSQVFDHCYWT